MSVRAFWVPTKERARYRACSRSAACRSPDGEPEHGACWSSTKPMEICLASDAVPTGRTTRFTAAATTPAAMSRASVASTSVALKTRMCRPLNRASAVDRRSAVCTRFSVRRSGISGAALNGYEYRLSAHRASVTVVCRSDQFGEAMAELVCIFPNPKARGRSPERGASVGNDGSGTTKPIRR